MAGSVPGPAAEEAPRQDASYYPISVEEYTYGVLDELRVKKVYQLSLSDDPSLIPTGDFERNGLWFTLLDMTRKNEVGVDTQPYTETVTRPSKTNDMAQVLQALEAEMEVTTSEGYAGTLHLGPHQRPGQDGRLRHQDQQPLRHPQLPQPLGRGCVPRPQEHRGQGQDPHPWPMSSGARRSMQTARAVP